MEDRDFIGGGVLAGGLLFFLLGIFTFSTKSLITSNFLLLLGLTISMGPKKLFSFIVQKNNIVGTIAFFVGFFLVIIKFALIGIFVEIGGFYFLCGGFLPMVATILGMIPYVGTFVPSSWKNKKESLD